MSITGTQPVTFTSPSSQAADYRIYGPLPAGNVVLSVRTPRTRNLLPFPYSGIFRTPEGSVNWSEAYWTDMSESGLVLTDHGDGTYSWDAQRSGNFRSHLLFHGNIKAEGGGTVIPVPPVYPPGTYTLSHNQGVSGDVQLELRVFSAETGNLILSATDEHRIGRITATIAESFMMMANIYIINNHNYPASYARPQFERGSSVTAYEPPNPATLTTITLPRALQEGEYLSFSEQKIMPAGTPVTLPALQTLVGENVLMIENYPRAVNQISVTPADAGINHIRIGETAPSGIYVGETPVSAVYAGENLIYRKG